MERPKSAEMCLYIMYVLYGVYRLIVYWIFGEIMHHSKFLRDLFSYATAEMTESLQLIWIKTTRLSFKEFSTIIEIMTWLYSKAKF